MIKRIEAAVRDGHLILTANQRLSRTLRGLYDDAQLGAGRSVWPSPAILPFSTWLQTQWPDAVIGGAVGAQTVLSAAQEESVWRAIIAEAPESASLLDLRGTAQSAMQAWRLIQQYRVPLDGRFEAQEDQAAFHGWALTYRKRCAANHWLDTARLPDAVRPVLEIPRGVLLAGFDEFTPQQESVLDALRATGCAVALLETALPESRVVRRGCGDPDEELRGAAEWARGQLDGGLARAIGVVLLNLGVRRARVERIFRAALEGRFHLTIPEPLRDYALVSSALLLIRLAPLARWPLAEAGLLLRSPFTAGGTNEAEARAVLDANLRRWRRSHVTVRAVAGQAASCPQLEGILSRWSELAFTGSRVPSEWAAAFRAVLEAAGWPGDIVLTSEEYQVFESFLDLLRTFSALDVVSGPIPLGAAVARLGDLASTALFQPQDPGAPVQVMGVLEAAGSRFDALWVCGATDQTWPAPAHPHPFLPLALQRELNLPHSSPERESEFARRTFGRLRSSAPEIVVSWPVRAGDVELRPSPLLDGIPDEEIPERAAVPKAAIETEQLADEAGPPLEHNHPRGGTRILKLQAACPFQAFADLRLGARPLDAAEMGLSALERGSAIHEALRTFWGIVKDHAALTAMTAADLRSTAERSARLALERPFRDSRLPFDVRFRELETERLAEVLIAQAEFEKERAPFRVFAQEDKRTVGIGGLEIEARIDRVDELPGGRQVIIDYKTTSPSPNAWAGTRPDEPQLPLYAISSAAPVDGVVFATVGPDGPGFRGYAAGEARLVGARTFPMPSGEQLAEWRRVLEPVAAAFRSGAAEVDPKARAICELCRLTPLCRVHEAAAQPEAEEAE